MELRIYDNMEQCTDEAVNNMLPIVPDWRRDKALKYKHTFGKFACLKSFVMLQEMVRTITNADNTLQLTFGYGEHGKPTLNEFPDIHFNISHCRNAIAVVVSDAPIGVDVESFHTADDALVRKTMNEEEERIIKESDDPMEMFTVFWTKKESVLKLHGTGIIDDLPGTLTGNEQIETIVNKEKKYVCSICKY